MAPSCPVQQDTDSRAALPRVLNTSFGGSIRPAVAAHLAQRDAGVSDEELKRLAELVRQARSKGR